MAGEEKAAWSRRLEGKQENRVFYLTVMTCCLILHSSLRVSPERKMSIREQSVPQASLMAKAQVAADWYARRGALIRITAKLKPQQSRINRRAESSKLFFVGKGEEGESGPEGPLKKPT
jgi:hypothetical protein